MRSMISMLAIALMLGCGGYEDGNQKAANGDAQQPPAAESNRGATYVSFGDAEVKIDYGRPKLGGKDRLAQAPAGYVWRFGMNEATSFTTGVPLKFGETEVAAGDYTLFLKRIDDTTWHLLVNSKTGQWGTEYDESLDVAAIPMTMAENEESVETFTIALEKSGENSGMLKAMWANAILSADFAAAGH